ncbi:MAG: OmpA family protein [Bacteroidota bacterium]
MKKITILLLAVFFIAGAAISQNADHKWAIGLGPGVNVNWNTADPNLMGNVYLSRYLSPSFDLMLDTRAGFFNEGWDFLNPLLNLRYKFNNGYIFDENSAVQPYLFGGVGYLWDNLSDGVNFDGGLGFKFPISKNTSLFVAGSFVTGIDGQRHNAAGNLVDVTDHHVQLTTIVEFALGVNDGDGDGVKDRKDECPDTPPGVAVDEKGCPIDRDGDGIPDYKDECPDEPGKAEFEGCPDKDADGIPDKDDDCPDVPGLTKFKGCPDSDEDGVPDPSDNCPNTPKGCPVDEKGCPTDSDGDGVIDCEDKCPNEVGPASNNGCPDWADLEELTSVFFDFDKADLKAEGKEALDKLAEQLMAAKEFELVISGHTCNIGTEDYNMELSEKRAQAVVKYLLSKGVNNAYVGSNHYGETKPTVENNSIENRKLNRRAEFDVAKIRK